VGEIFRTCPDRTWGPPSLLYNGYKVFPLGKERPGCDADPSPSSSAALTRSLERPKNRWDDDVKSDITRTKITKWKDCIRNRTKWKKLVEKAKTSLKL